MPIKILVTGAAGFIGSHLCRRLLNEGYQVTGIDNFDPFYPRTVKENNIKDVRENNNFKFIELDIRNIDGLNRLLDSEFDIMMHLAAKAGVRPSINNPIEYQEVNLYGTQNLLEFAQKREIKRIIFASSSSVYGTNPKVPWSEDDNVLQPISPYASSKVSAELLGHVYCNLYNIQFIALRLFTVFGPRQRPDLAIHKFIKLMLNNTPITLYGKGDTYRDYTNVNDIVNGFVKAIDYKATMYEIINLGNNRRISLIELVNILEEEMGIKANIIFEKEQPGDVKRTWADITKAGKLLDWKPMISIEDGIKEFVSWFKQENSEIKV